MQELATSTGRPDTRTRSSVAADPDEVDATPRRIRVWFGRELICSHVAEPEQAQRYAALVRQRFAGLRVTIDDAPGEDDTALPHELIWERTVR